MPHAEMKYSSDLNFDPMKLLTDIELLLSELDPSSGPCKGRAYPTNVFNHTHLLINIQLFATKERDIEYANAVIANAKELAETAIIQPCFITVELSFSPLTYYTGRHTP